MKKFISAMLCIAIIMVFSACSDDGATSSVATKPESVVSETSSNETSSTSKKPERPGRDEETSSTATSSEDSDAYKSVNALRNDTSLKDGDIVKLNFDYCKGEYIITSKICSDNDYSVIDLYNGKYAVRYFAEKNTFMKTAPTGSLVAHKGYNGFYDFITLQNGKSTYGAYPHNTLEGAVHAARLGFKIVEIDIQVTADNKWVVFHDDSTETLSGGLNKKISECTFEELKSLYITKEWIGGGYGFFTDKVNKEGISTLDSVLSALKNKDVIVILDTKWPNGKSYTSKNFDDLADLVRKYGMEERCAGYGASQNELVKRIPEAIVAFSSKPQVSDEEFANTLMGYKNYMFSVSTKEYSKYLDFCKKYNCPLAVWFSDDYNEIEKIFADGADFVLTNGCLKNPNLSDYKTLKTLTTSASKLSSDSEKTVDISISYKSLGLEPGDLISITAKADNAQNAFLRISTVGAPTLRKVEVNAQGTKTIYYIVNDNYEYDLVASVGVNGGKCDFSNIEVKILRDTIR